VPSSRAAAIEAALAASIPVRFPAMSTPSASTSGRLRVRSMTRQTPQVHSVVLESLDGRPLPPVRPGAHLDLRLGAGLSRSYSIVGHAGAPSRYEIAVAKDPNSRGGSRYVHEVLRIGDQIEVSEPRNLFELAADAPCSVLIAGGIGITPIWAMVQELERQGRPWTLHYAARSRVHAAFLADIEALARRSACGRLATHFDDEAGGQPLDIAAALASAPPDAHLYCCGPAPMLAAYEQAAASRPADRVHLERFAAAVDTSGDLEAFEIVLAKSARRLSVPKDKSILDVLLDHGIDAPYGCMQGVCGMCEVPVLDGTPEHRDQLLSDAAKASNACLLVCCSRSRSPTLTLDC
jgi:tetrachlorobenzoquinone reductase